MTNIQGLPADIGHASHRRTAFKHSPDHAVSPPNRQSSSGARKQRRLDKVLERFRMSLQVAGFVVSSAERSSPE